MNEVNLFGRLVRDPELRYVGDGVAVCKFNLAVNRPLSREKKQEYEAKGLSTADFPRVRVWGKMAENAAKFLVKGSRCVVSGAFTTDSYTNSKNERVYVSFVEARRVEFVDFNSSGRKGDGGSGGAYERADSASDYFGSDFAEISDDGCIPF